MIKDNLKKIIQRKKLTQEQAADLLGISQAALNLYLSGKRRIRVDFIERFMGVFKIPPEELFSIPISSVPVIGYVQAGVFQAAEQWNSGDFYAINPPVMPEYAGMKLFALEVRGDSMNELYPEGTCVVCVSVADIGMPETGKKVICEKHLPDGTIEATVKEYLETNGGDCEIIAVVIGSFRKE